VEALDARTLLSRVGAAVEPIVARASLQLVGELRGIAFDHGDIPSFQSKGNVSPLGPVRSAGGGDTLNGPNSITVLTGPNGAFNLITPHGQVYVATDVSSTGPRSFSGTYTIQGGTGAYAGATGTGAYSISYLSIRFIAHFG
jgi:hypothetical protein